MSELNILWQIVLKSQGIIEILRVTAEGGPRHPRRSRDAIHPTSKIGSYISRENSL